MMGRITTAVTVALVTVSPVDPEIPVAGSVAEMVVVPTFLPVASPLFLGALLTGATPVFDENQETNRVTLNDCPLP